MQSCQKSLAMANTLPPESNSNSLSQLGNSTIPLLSGHIVAQLNSLLFSVHGLTDKNLELNIQTQLASIYTRLQEMVTMINVAKKKDDTKESQVSSSTAAKKSLVTSATDEQKIAKQLEEYQKALLKTNQRTATDQFDPNQSFAKILESQTQSSSEHLKLDLNNRKSYEDPAISDTQLTRAVDRDIEKSVIENLRRRTSKDSYQDSPPEKRIRAPHTISPQPTSSGSSSGRSKSSGKGGKGIRNRVFCGDCPGCLKNDDCGQCRYCRDKTKFGGQNRLRQKCLHRRCQMDTHRRSNGSSNSLQPSDGVSTSPGPVYSGVSGVDLARYTRSEESGEVGANDADGGGRDVTRLPHHKMIAEHSIFTSLLGHSVTLQQSDKTSGSVEKDADVSGAVGDTSQTRSDKWKAKHEAMLKLAVSPTQSAGNLSSENNATDSEHTPTLKKKQESSRQDSNNDKNNASIRNHNSKRPRHESRGSDDQIKTSDNVVEVTRMSTSTRSMKPVLAL